MMRARPGYRARVPIRAVIFDLDNTLILEDESTMAAVDAAAGLAHERAGVDRAGLVDATVAVAESIWKASPAYRFGEVFGIWWGEALWGEFRGDEDVSRRMREFAPSFREVVWHRALERLGVSDDALAETLAREYIRVRRRAESIDVEAAPMLATLARGYRLALLTNGAGDVQREKLSRTPFADTFEVVVISGEAGVGKPDPRIFQIALQRLGMDAAGSVYVGDSLVRDVAGAHAAGLLAVWLDRKLWQEPEAIRPDARIERLSDLPAALADLERRAASPRATT